MFTARMIAQKLRGFAAQVKSKFVTDHKPVSDESVLKARAGIEFLSMLIDSIEPSKLEKAFAFGVEARLCDKGSANKAMEGLAVVQQGLGVLSSAITKQNLETLNEHFQLRNSATMNLLADCLERAEHVDRSVILEELARVDQDKLNEYDDLVRTKVTLEKSIADAKETAKSSGLIGSERRAAEMRLGDLQSEHFEACRAVDRGYENVKHLLPDSDY